MLHKKLDMKQNFIILSSLLFFAISCTKDRTCECTSSGTSTYTGASPFTNRDTIFTTVNTPQVQTTVYKKVKKSDLGTICGDQKYTSSSTSTSSNGTKNTNSYTSEVKCEIK